MESWSCSFVSTELGILLGSLAFFAMSGVKRAFVGELTKTVLSAVMSLCGRTFLDDFFFLGGRLFSLS